MYVHIPHRSTHIPTYMHTYIYMCTGTGTYHYLSSGRHDYMSVCMHVCFLVPEVRVRNHRSGEEKESFARGPQQPEVCLRTYEASRNSFVYLSTDLCGTTEPPRPRGSNPDNGRAMREHACIHRVSCLCRSLSLSTCLSTHLEDQQMLVYHRGSTQELYATEAQI